MRKLRTWLLVLAAAMVGATALSTPAIAAPVATPNAVVTEPGVHGHTCRSLGNDGTYQGVICVDLIVFESAQPGTYGMYGEAEAVCEKLSNNEVVRCADVKLWLVMEQPDGVTPPILGVCGHSLSLCEPPPYRNGWFTEIWDVADGRCLPVRTTIYWQLQNGPQTAIELPESGKILKMATGTSLSTPWFKVGNGC